MLTSQVGGVEEYRIVEALKDGRINKPLIAWCIGTCARMFTSEVKSSQIKMSDWECVCMRVCAYARTCVHKCVHDLRNLHHTNEIFMWLNLNLIVIVHAWLLFVVRYLLMHMYEWNVAKTDSCAHLMSLAD